MNLRAQLDEVVARHGPWTAHNMELADGLFTISPAPAGDEVKLRRVVQLVSDLLGGQLAGARVLDLACLEGMYALELARRGARVTAIEGREQNLAKAQFAATALGLEVDFQLGDVRQLSRQEHGEFDVVLCLGILYHLDAPDVFVFLERLAEVCDGLCVLDTHVTDSTAERFSHGGRSYRGRSFAEPDTSDPLAQDTLWASLDNPRSVVLTR